MSRNERLTSSCIEDLWLVLVWLRMQTRIQGWCALDRRAAAIAWRTLIRRRCQHIVSSPRLPPRRRGRRPVPGTFRTEVRHRQPRDTGSPSPARASRLACHDYSPQPSTSPGRPSLTIGVQLGGSLAGKLSRELASILSRAMLLVSTGSGALLTNRLLRISKFPASSMHPRLASRSVRMRRCTGTRFTGSTIVRGRSAAPDSETTQIRSPMACGGPRSPSADSAAVSRSA
jgi:hypothetical protein